MMCEHLIGLETELKEKGIKETFRGKAWSENCHEWVYYDCVLNLEKIMKKYNFPDFVKIHVNADNKSGMESGLYCEVCKDAIIGLHPNFVKTK